MLAVCTHGALALCHRVSPARSHTDTEEWAPCGKLCQLVQLVKSTIIEVPKHKLTRRTEGNQAGARSWPNMPQSNLTHLESVFLAAATVIDCARPEYHDQATSCDEEMQDSVRAPRSGPPAASTLVSWSHTTRKISVANLNAFSIASVKSTNDIIAFNTVTSLLQRSIVPKFSSHNTQQQHRKPTTTTIMKSSISLLSFCLLLLSTSIQFARAQEDEDVPEEQDQGTNFYIILFGSAAVAFCAMGIMRNYCCGSKSAAGEEPATQVPHDTA